MTNRQTRLQLTFTSDGPAVCSDKAGLARAEVKDTAGGGMSGTHGVTTAVNAVHAGIATTARALCKGTGHLTKGQLILQSGQCSFCMCSFRGQVLPDGCDSKMIICGYFIYKF